MEKKYVDEIMSHMQVAFKKAAIVGFGPLPVRMGVVGSRSRSRETCRDLRINKEGCLKVAIGAVKLQPATSGRAVTALECPVCCTNLDVGSRFDSSNARGSG
jgi:hypothetical protein